MPAAAERSDAHLRGQRRVGQMQQRMLEGDAEQGTPTPSGWVVAEQGGGFGPRGVQRLGDERTGVGVARELDDHGGVQVGHNILRPQGPAGEGGVQVPVIPNGEERPLRRLGGQRAIPSVEKCAGRQRRHQCLRQAGNIVSLQGQGIFQRVGFGAAQRLHQAPLPPRRRPLEPHPTLGDGVARRQRVGVRRGDEAARRVVFLRQRIHVEEPAPFVAAVARHRQQAIVGVAAWEQPGRLVADVAVDVRIHLILGGCAPAVQRGAELTPVLGAHVLHAAEVGRHAGFQPAGAHGVDALVVPMDDRPVVGELQGGRHRFAILHSDGLDDGLDRRGRRIEVEILLIDAEDREAERDALVVANGDAGQGRFAGADDVEPRRHEVRDVAQRRHGVAAVGVVGEHGLAALGAGRCDDPVVAARGGAQLGLRGPLVQVRLEAHGRRGQQVVLQHVGRDGAGV